MSTELCCDQRAEQPARADGVLWSPAAAVHGAARSPPPACHGGCDTVHTVDGLSYTMPSTVFVCLLTGLLLPSCLLSVWFWGNGRTVISTETSLCLIWFGRCSEMIDTVHKQ